MRVLLVGPDHEANLSVGYLASSLRAAGHVPTFAPFNCASDIDSVRRKAEGTDLVGLSLCFQVRAPEFLQLADCLKEDEPTRPIVAGGHYASCAAEDLLARHPSLDLIVIHEGERTLVELADLGTSLLTRAAEVPGVAVRREGKVVFSPVRPILDNLETLPWPDRPGPARLLCGVPVAYMMGSRGCVSSCDYCCITTLHRMAPGRRFRQRSPEDVAAEMAELYHHRGVRLYVFHDDNFLVPSHAHNQDRVHRLEAALEARGVRDIGLVLKCSPRDAEPRIIGELRRLGLLRLFMGIESGSSCGLESIGRRQTVEQSERALSICEELGISTQYTMIIFTPEATIDTMLADLEFVRRHPAHPLNYCRAEVYAGTPLEARMLASGRAQGDYLGRTYRYTDPKVERVWEVGSGLFAGRCWGQYELLGQVIRLDHQVAVLGHFYEGKQVQRLVKSFAEWEVDLNLETAAFFRELVIACGEASSNDAPALRRTLSDIRRRELSSRSARLARLCEFRKALEGFAERSVEQGRRHALGLTRGRRLVPRHAAAVAAAIGLLGSQLCIAGEPGASGTAPRPVNPRPRRSRPDAGTPEPVPVPVEEAPYRPDHGVAEAAPPPYDYRKDLGVAEAAPPPYDPREDPNAVLGLRISTGQGVLEANDKKVGSSYFLRADHGGVLTLTGGPKEAPLKVKMTVQARGRNKFTFRVTANRPSTLSFGGRKNNTPTLVMVLAEQGPQTLVIEDAQSGARLTLRVAPVSSQ